MNNKPFDLEKLMKNLPNVLGAGLLVLGGIGYSMPQHYYVTKDSQIFNRDKETISVAYAAPRHVDKKDARETTVAFVQERPLSSKPHITFDKMVSDEVVGESGEILNFEDFKSIYRQYKGSGDIRFERVLLSSDHDNFIVKKLSDDQIRMLRYYEVFTPNDTDGVWGMPKYLLIRA